ncbi:carboxypeptidase-like regulatory domain-containing protein [Flavobacterium stagni]|uniref:Carboxypeptidase-like regulatory domain-containing protein n=1 Tax=Flavobacterium stagni TaxID=2506421 RepID=A0A4Q1KAM7_9FLAO|nr:carboxypeptidase-like regulatory domain-containing protein [Flavobacterium stagni]RXR23965.1 hypothetical protein EQG61_00560 [Flavobacterium stagni]
MRKWLFLLFVIQCSWSQNEPVWLEGLVVSELRNELANINVSNIVTNATVMTNETGRFRIPVQLNEALKISAVGYEEQFVKIDEALYKKKQLVVKLRAAVYNLDEVRVVKLDAQKMGIIDYKPKHYTPAERKLRTAGQFSPWQILMIPLGGMPLDPMINAITGRTAMLKKELEVERKELALAALTTKLDSLYFADQLHLAPDQVKAFQYYAVENAEVRALVKSDNLIPLKFKLSQLLVEFLKPKESDEKK